MPVSADPREGAALHSTISAVDDLGQRELILLADAVASVAPNWSVELCHVFSEGAHLVIMPEDANDVLGPTLIIRHASDAYYLDQFHWDHYKELGTFTDISKLVSTVRMQILRCANC
jgi:hypothetical protein